MTNEVIVDD